MTTPLTIVCAIRGGDVGRCDSFITATHSVATWDVIIAQAPCLRGYHLQPVQPHPRYVWWI